MALCKHAFRRKGRLKRSPMNAEYKAASEVEARAVEELKAAKGKKVDLLLAQKVSQAHLSLKEKGEAVNEANNGLVEAERILAKWQSRKSELGTLQEQLSDLLQLEKGLAQDPFYLSLTFILPRERDTRDSLKGLQQFFGTMKKVNEPISIGEIIYEPASVKHATFKVSKVSEIPEGAAPPAREVKEYGFDFKPYSAAQLGVGGALVYSFAKQHKFEASPVVGGFKITDTGAGDYSGTNVAAMLTLVPSGWAESDVHGIFEIGVQPQTNLGFFAGVGLTFLKSFSIGLGTSFQQEDQLKSGLQIGDLLPSKDGLKTQKRFGTGVYFHITASANLTGK